MACQNLFSKGFPTNRIPVTLPSSGKPIVLRETTVTELKSMAKIVIDNFDRRQMDVIYDAATEYLQSMILTDGIDVWKLTEFDRLFCLMVFFQMSFYKEPTEYKCPHCGVDIRYRYDMSKYLSAMSSAYVEDQTVKIPFKSKEYEFVIGWPTTETVSQLHKHFYSELGNVTEEMERTQFGIEYVLSFISKISVTNPFVDPNLPETVLDMSTLDFKSRLECINLLPSLVVFDEESGVFNKVMGYFVNRLENCFSSEVCPQCHKETNYGLPTSSLFFSLFYGSLKSLLGFIMQVECLLMFRYDCCIFDKEQHMTYNDLQSLVHQLSATMEKENKERQKIGKDNLSKGLWYIREILNTLVFPEDRKHNPT